MVKYCKNCGNELEEGSVFCNECGTKFGESAPSRNISSNVGDNPFSRYNVDMIEGEKVIRSSQIHEGCLYLPLVVIGIGLMLGFLTLIIMINMAYIDFGMLLGSFLNGITIIGIIWLIIRYIGYKNNDLILTNKRVFGKCGLISTTQMQSPLSKIDSVSFTNGLVGKLIGYGTVEVATTSSHFKFRFIRDGQTFYNDIFNQLEISQKEKRIEDAQAIADAISQK